ncbi:hypothetical protein Q0Z83_098880 [Actinoplanes sichuanensis]|uniref:Uncharacterized protein n=1 Tax=Actinoplanes sichuanensis TaxID=512349 RepID=A0ABW4AEP2_9ACTN|nr:hypothetical protein [Actinoplanes sichuanensis]BEL11697.1 hypothetical protein Q0Z83_098880 [Actinoplanes sichuanensis]
MPHITDGFSTRRLLTVGVAALAFASVTPSAAYAVPAQPLPQAALAAAVDMYEAKLAVAVKFGLGDDFSLPERADRDFVYAIWSHVRDKPRHAEVRVAAEIALDAAPEDSAQASVDFILTEVYAAFDRDVERERQIAEAKRLSDLARTTAAAAIDVVADAALLTGTDDQFLLKIHDLVDEARWPLVKAGADAARKGSAEQQTAFIAAGLAAAAKQDTEDWIRKDKERTEAEKADALARAAKQYAANRIGLPVTEQLLSMPDRDFVVTVWTHADEGTEVQIAAIAAARSLVPADWKAFIDTGVHQAKDRDIQIALEKKEADDRKAVQGIVDRSLKAGYVTLAAAAQTALTGSYTDVVRFLQTGQYQVRTDIAAVAVSGNRIGILTADGVAYVKEGTLGATWEKEYSGVKQLVLAGDRIGVLTNDGVALVKEGHLGAAWVTEQTGIKQLALDGDRIGVLTTGGIAYVKEGSLSAGWVNEYSNVQQIALSGNRIGVLTTAGAALVKQGTLSAAWSTQHTGMKQLVLAGTRIGVLSTGGIAYVKEGALNASWVNEHSGIKQLTLTTTRIGVLTTGGIAYVKEGGLSTAWVNEYSGVQQHALSGNRIAIVTGDRIALVKEGGLGAAWTTFRTAPEAA